MSFRQRFGLGLLILFCTFSIMVMLIPDGPSLGVTICGALCSLAFIMFIWEEE